MRSVNSARKAGRDFGRQVEDIWLPDDLIRAQVARTITPRIKLLKTAEDGTAEAWQAAILLSVVLALPPLVVLTLMLLPNKTLADLTWLRDVDESLDNLPLFLVIIIVVALVGLAALCIGAQRAARDRADAVEARATNELLAAAAEGALSVLASRRSTVGMPVEDRPNRSLPRPSSQPRGVDPRGAELLVAQWMRYLGEHDATVTQFSSDGGVDVAGSRYIAQVKHYSSRVGVAVIRELAGVAAADGYARRPLFFTRTGYAAAAVAFAENSGVALFVYNAEDGDLLAMNGLAKTLMHNGLQ